MPDPKKEIEELLNPILTAFRQRLEATVLVHAVTGYIRGSAQMVSYGQTLGGKPILFEGPPMQEAINWANKHAAQMVTKMDFETQERLAKVIADGIKNKRGIDGLARDIRTQFDNMSKVRSKMIARTETADSLSAGSIERMKKMDITGKSWVWGGVDCEICQGNEDAGVIGIDESFPSGHDRPPAHPNCICALAPEMMEE